MVFEAGLTVLAISTSCSDESGAPGANCIDRTDCDADQCSESEMVECVFTGDDVIGACTCVAAGTGGNGGSAGSAGSAGAGGSAGTGGSAGSGGVAASGLEGCTAVNSLDSVCECDPLSATSCDAPSSNLRCSLNLFTDTQTGVVVGIPALDGSDDYPATECISEHIQPDGEGASCTITTLPFDTLTAKRDSCMQGLYCLGVDDRRCVKLCKDSADCGRGSCALFDLGAAAVTLGRCQ